MKKLLFFGLLLSLYFPSWAQNTLPRYAGVYYKLGQNTTSYETIANTAAATVPAASHAF